MPVKCLSKTAQNEVVRFTRTEQYNQTELAELFQVSRRTIQRVLLDHGVICYNTQPAALENDPTHKTHIHDLQNKTMVNMLREKGHTPTTLKQLMDAPTLTHRNVEMYLTHLPEDDLAKLTYVIGLVRIKMQDRRDQEAFQKREAANG